MRYGKRSFFKRISASPVALAVVMALAVFLAKAVWNINSKVKASAMKLTQAQTELARLQQHQQDISTEVSKLSTNEGIESELRTKYRAVNEGESVAVIVGDNGTSSSSAFGASSDQSASAVSAQPSSWWQRMLNVVGL